MDIKSKRLNIKEFLSYSYFQKTQFYGKKILLKYILGKVTENEIENDLLSRKTVNKYIKFYK